MPLAAISEYLDDELSLGEFVLLWWASEAPSGDHPEELDNFLDRKQALIRMLRKSRPAFPEPTGASGRTRLYRLGDLEDWMSGEGVWPASADLESRLAGVSPLWRLRRAEDACRRELDSGFVRRLEVALLVALHVLGTGGRSVRPPAAVRRLLAADDRTVDALRAEVPKLERSVPDLRGVIDGLLDGVSTEVAGSSRLAGAIVDALANAIPPSNLLDIILDRLPSAPAVGGGSPLTATGLSRLVVSAADPRPGEHILDLAAGEGGLLLAAADGAEGTVELTGYEADPVSWAIARTRFYLRGLAVDLRLEKSLDGEALLPTADLVLVDPPLEGRRTYHRWLSAAAACMGPGGRAVVVLPVVSLDTSRREWREVGDRVGIVVRATSRLRTDHGDALALWVLEDRPGPDVLMIDASRLGRQRGQLHEVGLEEADVLRGAVRSWRSDGTAENGMHLRTATSPRTELDGAGAVALARATVRSRKSDLTLRSSQPVLEELVEARKLTDRLARLVNGPLANYTSEEHRRALNRLLVRLDGYLEEEE